eukprot:2461457-Pleurochrysis_carterae.AAC.1
MGMEQLLKSQQLSPRNQMCNPGIMGDLGSTAQVAFQHLMLMASHLTIVNPAVLPHARHTLALGTGNKSSSFQRLYAQRNNHRVAIKEDSTLSAHVNPPFVSPLYALAYLLSVAVMLMQNILFSTDLNHRSDETPRFEMIEHHELELAIDQCCGVQPSRRALLSGPCSAQRCTASGDKNEADVAQ